MKKVFLTVIMCMSMAAFSQTVEEVVAKHIEARGGAEKLKSVKNMVMENTMAVQGMEFNNKTTIVIGKAMKSETTLMGSEMIQSFDGEKAWMVRPAMMGGTGEPEEVSAVIAKEIASQADPFSLLDYREKGTTIVLLENEKVNKIEAFHLKITAKDGTNTEMWVNSTDYLISKVKVSAMGMDQELAYSNFKVTDGISFPMTMEMENPQAGTITATTNKIVLNSTLDDAMFKMPAKK